MLRSEPRASDPEMASLAGTVPPAEDRSSGERGYDHLLQASRHFAPGIERRRRQARQGRRGGEAPGGNQPPPDRWD